jgi:ATP-dependent helicase/nuclease subunit A
MSTGWTKEQLMAINTRGSNLLVSAAAGTGKTAVLVARIISLISNEQHPVDIDRLLVVTFTNAAAAEIRSRINEAINDKLSENPHSRHLRRQSNLLNRSSISTLHSFCLNVLRQYFHRVGLDPAVRVADEDEAALLRTAACDELFERCYDSRDNTAFTMLVDCYGGARDDSALQDMVLRLYDFARSTPDPQGWLHSAAAAFCLSPRTGMEDLPWAGILKQFIACELGAVLQMIKSAMHLSSRPGGPAAYLETLQNDLGQVQRLEHYCNCQWEELQEAFGNLTFAPLSRVGKEVDEELKNQVRTLREKARKKMTGLASTFFSRSPAEYLAEINLIAPLIKELAQLVLDFEEIYRQAKSSRGLVDFSDLEHYALQILGLPCAGTGRLTPSDIALEFREQFVEVLIDEYQDINAVQEAILMLVSRQGEAMPNLFMVGDVKQSIYRFRLAEPGLFLAKQKSYISLTGDRFKENEMSCSETCLPVCRLPAPVARQAGAGTGRRAPHRQGVQAGKVISLTRNFRSQKNVIDGVNYIFRQIMTPGAGEIAYDGEAELIYGADFLREGKVRLLEDTVELHLLHHGQDMSPSEEAPAEDGEDRSEESFEELEVQQVEARFIAMRIREMVKKSRQEYLHLAYRDIVVLMRSTIEAAGIFLEEFGKMGVPAYAEASGGYFQATEMKTILSLLTVIDNPRQDIPLAGVLRSALVGASAEELAQIRLCQKDGDFFDAVVAAAKENPGRLPAKLTAFLTQLDHWRTMSRRGRLPDLIWDIYRQTGYYDYAGGLPGGAQRQANLRALHDRACQYEATTFRGLFRFLKFIERLAQHNRDLGMARALGENENVVRIMSIHKSKGLEFPVVFIAGLGRQFNFQDLNKNVLLHRDLGLGPQLVDINARVSYPTLPKLAVKARLKLETLAEELRILYVAMTRAQEKLILVGSVRDLEKAAEKWCSVLEIKEQQLPDSQLTAARTFLDWLGAALARHRDGEPLRRAAGCNFGLNVLNDDSRWQVSLREGADAALSLPVRCTSTCAGTADRQTGVAGRMNPDVRRLLEKVQRLEPVAVGREETNQVKQRLSWSYPFAAYSGKPAKMAVTAAKRLFDLLPYEEDPAIIVGQTQDRSSPGSLRPLFLQAGQGLSAAERGRAMHLVMQHLDFQKSLTESGIRDQIAAMQLQELLTFEQAGSINVKSILGFLKSPLGERVLAAKEVRREIPFTLALPAHEVYPSLEEELSGGRSKPTPESVDGSPFSGIPAGGSVVLQGMIDCLADEGDGLVIIDFKSDYVKPGDWQGLQQLAAFYRGQLNLYGRAAGVILNRPVKEKYLYFFSTGSAIQV